MAKPSRVESLLKSRGVLALAFLIAFPFVYFFPVTLMQGVWFSLDIIRLYLPVEVELARALSEGRLPLWTPYMLAGFPLLAEGHASAFYPLNQLLFRILPAHFAISYSMIFHLAWTGSGMYLCARVMGFRWLPALFAGFVFSFNGFTLEKLYHLPILVTGSWLPWLILLQKKFQQARLQNNPRASLWFFLCAISIGLQLIAGFPQIALLSAIAFVFFGLVDQFSSRATWRTIGSGIIWSCLPLVVGAGIAAIQIIPTVELIGYSVRNAPLSENFLTEYSLPLSFLPQFFFPYVQGEPIEQTNEYWAYFGFLPFILAVAAPFLRRDRRTFLYALFAVLMLSLALGRFNPIYPFVERLPVFSLFRTPARFIYLFLFAAAILSAVGFEELSRRLTSPRESINRAARWGIVFLILTLISFVLTHTQSMEFWLTVWKFLPWALGFFVTVLMTLAHKRKIDGITFSTAVLGITLFDLVSYAPPFLLTFDQLTLPSYVIGIPRSISALETERSIGRVYTDVSLYPTVPALRNSLFPNVPLIYKIESIQAYSPLTFQRHDKYLAELSPTMLNLLNVEFVLVPLEPRLTDRTSEPPASFRLDVVNEQVTIPATEARYVDVASFVEQVADFPYGKPIAEIQMTLDDDAVEVFPLRFGIETDAWDSFSSQARIAHAFSIFKRSNSRVSEGHTYLARFELSPRGQQHRVVAVGVRSFLPNGQLSIERVSLVDGARRLASLATLTGKNNFSLFYQSDTVAIWKNEDMLPRAFIVHDARIVDDDAALARLKQDGFRADRIVLLSEGEALEDDVVPSEPQDAVRITQYAPESVCISLTADRMGYLFLADSWYPGWEAYVDGQRAPIYRADLIFRAVPIEAGDHHVIFEYRPMSLVVGAVMSAASLFIAGGIAFAFNRRWL